MSPDIEHPDITSILRTGYPAWAQPTDEEMEEEDNDDLGD